MPSEDENNSTQEQEQSSRLRARAELYERAAQAQEEKKAKEKRKRDPLLHKVTGTGPLQDPDGDAIGAAIAGTAPAARSVTQIVDRYLPLTHRLHPVLPKDTLSLSDIEGLDVASYDANFRRAAFVVSQLEEQFERSDEAYHPSLVDAAETLLRDKAVTARFMLELFGLLKHVRGYNYPTWAQWEEYQRGSATVVLYHYVISFDQLFKPRTPQEHLAATAHAVDAFMHYVDQAALPDEEHTPRYRAIKMLLLKAVEVGGISPPDFEM